MAKPRFSVEEILAIVRATGKRVTVAKRTVAEVLVRAPGHLSADELTEAVQEREPDVSPSTVYRILEEFETLGVVVHAHLGQTAAVYHLTGAVHAHLTCDQCHQTFQIPANHFDALAADLAATYGFALDRHHVAISGICAHCAATQNRTGT